MQETKTLGLAGKARRNRVRGQASQRYTQDLLAEYFDAEAEAERTRQIPIKRCKAVVERNTPGTGTRSFYRVQDKLVLGTPQRKTRRGDREVVWAPSSETAARSKLIDESLLQAVKAMPKPSPAADQPIRFKPAARGASTKPSALPFPQEWRPPMAYRSRRRSRSLGGFAYGCLLGGAAAAVLLLIVRVVVG